MRIHLRKEFFSEKEFVFLEKGQMKVTFFRYSTGVEAIKVENSKGYQNTGDGACYVSHPVDVLPYGIRWMSRTGDEDSCGMVLPATAEHFGYQNAKRNGQIKVLGGKETLEFDIEAGWLDADRTDKIIVAKGLV